MCTPPTIANVTFAGDRFSHGDVIRARVDCDVMHFGEGATERRCVSGNIVPDFYSVPLSCKSLIFFVFIIFSQVQSFFFFFFLTCISLCLSNCFNIYVSHAQVCILFSVFLNGKVVLEFYSALL